MLKLEHGFQTPANFSGVYFNKKDISANTRKLEKKAKSLKTSDRDSTITEKDCCPSCPEWNVGKSQLLWLPTATDSVVSELSSSKESCERTMRHSWFSVRKLSTKMSKLSLPTIFSTSATTSSPKGMVKKPQDTEENVQLRVRKYRLHLTKTVKQKFKLWFAATRWVYNKCVEYSKKNDKINLKSLRDYTINSKTIAHDTLITAKLEKVPYDVKDSAIRDFIKALSIQKKMVKEGKRKFFEMKFRSRLQIQSLGIYHKHIKVKSDELTCFPTFFAKDDVSLHCREKISKITHDTRLSWNGRDTFLLHVPIDIKINDNRQDKANVCSIDPGEVIFSTIYGSDGNAYLIGENGSKKVDKIASIASRMRNGIKRVRRKDGTKKFVHLKGRKSSRTRKHLRDKAKDLEHRAKNMISDIHLKTVVFLTQKYDTIIVPKFETQSMTTRLNSDGKWKRKMGKSTTRRLIRWSHFNFRELLKAKAGDRVVVGTEEWTSKTCGNCFAINDKLGGSRKFKCSECGIKIHRDINGARNIMLLNWDRANLTDRLPST